AEVPTQLAHHRRDRVARERHADIGVEPLDRFQEAKLPDLDQVVERFTTMRESPRTVNGHPAVLLDELVAQRSVTGLAPATEALFGLLLRLSSPRRLLFGSRLRHRRQRRPCACTTAR